MGTMNDTPVLIRQVVPDISSQAVRLDVVCQQKFLEWLKSDSIKVKTVTQESIEVAVHGEGGLDERLKNGLKS